MKLDASRRLAEVINDMRSELALNKEEVVVLLRHAIDVLEGIPPGVAACNFCISHCFNLPLA
jgi:hypothetical protein